jgi:hypothetical protein
MRSTFSRLSVRIPSPYAQRATASFARFLPWWGSPSTVPASTATTRVPPVARQESPQKPHPRARHRHRRRPQRLQRNPQRDRQGRPARAPLAPARASATTYRRPSAPVRWLVALELFVIATGATPRAFIGCPVAPVFGTVALRDLRIGACRIFR